MKKTTFSRTSSYPLLYGTMALLFATVFLSQANAMGMLYSDEIYTSRNVGGGYEAGDSVYFLIDYGLYRKPQGIARFPDGGISRYVSRNVYLCRADRNNSSVQNLMAVMPGHTPGLDVKYSYFELHDGLLMILFKGAHGSEDDSQRWRALGWNIRTEQPITLSETQRTGLVERLTFNNDGRVSISETTELLEQATLEDLDLPSPLDYISRSDRQYGNDLVELRGDRSYRRAIVDAIADGSIQADPDDRLHRMAEKLNSLDEPYRGLYGMRAAEIIEILDELNE